MRAIHVVSVFAATALLALTGCAEEQAAPEATNSAATTAPSAAATDEPAEVTPSDLSRATLVRWGRLEFLDDVSGLALERRRGRDLLTA